MVHFQRVYCKVRTCQFSRVGFVNKSALRAHTRKFHAENAILPIPPKLRRSPDTMGQSSTWNETKTAHVDPAPTGVSNSTSPLSRFQQTAQRRAAALVEQRLAQQLAQQRPPRPTITIPTSPQQSDQKNSPPRPRDRSVHSIFTPIDDSESMLAAHWGSESPQYYAREDLEPLPRREAPKIEWSDSILYERSLDERIREDQARKQAVIQRQMRR